MPARTPKGQFTKGESGNPGGRPKSKLWREAILEALNAAGNGNGKKLRLLAKKIVEQALAGDVSAMREIGDRIDGKPHQPVELNPGDELINLLASFDKSGGGATDS